MEKWPQSPAVVGRPDLMAEVGFYGWTLKVHTHPPSRGSEGLGSEIMSSLDKVRLWAPWSQCTGTGQYFCNKEFVLGGPGITSTGSTPLVISPLWGLYSPPRLLSRRKCLKMEFTLRGEQSFYRPNGSPATTTKFIRWCHNLPWDCILVGKQS